MKEKIVAVRISDVLWNEIEEYSKNNNLTKSRIVRDAITKFLKFYQNPIPLILWGKNEFSFTLQCLNETELEQLAEISFQNGLGVKDYSIRKFADIKDPKNIKLNPRLVVNMLVTNTYTSKGQNWFNHIKAIWKKNWLMVVGTHDNGLNFSKYIKYVFLKWMEFYSFRLLKDELQENQLVLEFEKYE
ncbi:MAG: hypothetical protein ACFFHV_20455 [Promethearchaeota archaeon]